MTSTPKSPQEARFTRLRQFILANQGTRAHSAFGALALQCHTMAAAREFDWLCTALEIYEEGERADARTVLNFVRGAYQPLAWASVGLTLPEYKALQESP